VTVMTLYVELWFTHCIVLMFSDPLWLFVALGWLREGHGSTICEKLCSKSWAFMDKLEEKLKVEIQATEPVLMLPLPHF